MLITTQSTIEDYPTAISAMDKHATALANPQFDLDDLSIDIYLDRNKNSPLGQLHLAFLAFISELEKYQLRDDPFQEKDSLSDTLFKFDDYHSMLPS